MEELVEVPLSHSSRAIPTRIIELAVEGMRRAKKVDCFDYVPSGYAAMFAVLDASPRGRLCEWGSGIGIGVGLATILGFDAVGIELNSEMANESRQLLADFQLAATIHTGSYFDIDLPAEWYYVYCWPGQFMKVESLYYERAPPTSKLLICHGAEDIRCKIRPVAA